MPYFIRHAIPADIPKLSELVDAYMQETFQKAWKGTPAQLKKDGFGAEFEMFVAETRERETIAFAAWRTSYDLHVCLKGGEVIDLFVCPEHRSRGVAMNLIVAVANEIQKRGGAYIKGQAVNGATERFYQRFASCFMEANCIVSGRGFRQLAELSGKGLRELVRGLPQPSWNYEP